jgi:hypothetical protein
MFRMVRLWNGWWFWRSLDVGWIGKRIELAVEGVYKPELERHYSILPEKQQLVVYRDF